MRKEVIETGKVLDSTIDAACEKLGCSREDCEIEVLELPKKSFFGFKSTPYKVKVWIDLPEPKTQKKQPVRQDAKPAPARAAQQPRREKPVAAKPAPVKKPVAQGPAPVKQEEPVGAEPKQPGENHEAKVALARDYVASILKEMNLNAELKVNYDPEGVCINIEGQGLGMIIGRRGETLDAMQYLSGLVANRLEGDYLRVTIDCGDYRAKREETLQALARKLAAQVLKTNVSKTLEPMNPFERRIIHATVSEIEGVSSLSIGEEPNRRVVITSPTARSRNNRGKGRDNRSGSDRRDRRPPRSSGPRRENSDRRDSTPRPPVTRPAVTVPVEQAMPKQTPESVSDKPLYAKIDLE